MTMVRAAFACAVALLLGACSALPGPATPAGAKGGAAAARFAAAVHSPPQLRAFLAAMPKGGDLHIHLSGAAYAEGMIAAGAARGACADAKTAQVAPPPCDAAKGLRPLVDALKDAAWSRTLVNAWSMRSFVPTPGKSGHDHFFSTFRTFGGASDGAAMIAEVSDRAAAQHMRYLEPMITFQGGPVRAIAGNMPWPGDSAADMDALRDRLMGMGLGRMVDAARAEIDALDAKRAAIQRCGMAGAAPGCRVAVRWLQQVNRTAPPASVYAQTLFAFLLVRADPRVVGLNFVAPEDDPTALADYSRQMRMVGHLHAAMPDVKIALHAGELTMGLVPPADLRFHVREAVEVAHASRIGHGVDVMYEDRPADLLARMARERVAVEINLTSNDQILGVAGNRHPFPVYRAAGVPTVISTDDEGVERIDRTHELQRAVETYGLSWDDLVGLERNTLEYAFLPGASLWADPVAWQPVAACAVSPLGPPPAACARFLDGSRKAYLQWSLERDLAVFDRQTAGH